ncbi:MAG: glycosyltransferase family 2 protein [Leptospiraceae bacterium]|nr:glycosyltransferase family 2 protein [Leptospiraceae bacterium]
MKNLIVIPAYNEESTIEEVVRGAIKYADVIVVDDASKDSTPQILEKLKSEFPGKLHSIRHPSNTHIPGGIQDGMKFAFENNYDYVVTMDAGMSHDPEMLPQFFDYPNCDLLIGSREKTEGVPIYRKVISWLAARVMNYCIAKGKFDLFGPGIKDCTSGFRRYSKEAYSRIAKHQLESIAFDFHMEALALTYRNGGSVREIGIYYKFSNSSFNKKVFKLAISFAMKLFRRKWGFSK